MSATRQCAFRRGAQSIGTNGDHSARLMACGGRTSTVVFWAYLCSNTIALWFDGPATGRSRLRTTAVALLPAMIDSTRDTTASVQSFQSSKVLRWDSDPAQRDDGGSGGDVDRGRGERDGSDQAIGGCGCGFVISLIHLAGTIHLAECCLDSP